MSSRVEQFLQLREVIYKACVDMHLRPEQAAPMILTMFAELLGTEMVKCTVECKDDNVYTIIREPFEDEDGNEFPSTSVH